jgi:hypothetical protein
MSLGCFFSKDLMPKNVIIMFLAKSKSAVILKLAAKTKITDETAIVFTTILGKYLFLKS